VATLGGSLSSATRRALIRAITERHHSDGRAEKKKILDEFIKVTGLEARDPGTEKDGRVAGNKHGDRGSMTRRFVAR
jgi:hypothetical protein